MENIKKYKDIFTEQFLNFFGDNKDLISEIELQSDEYSIDVDKIIEKLGISVEGTFFDTHSGQYDADNKKMYINLLESPQRQRFTKSHELGHFVFNHGGISDREQTPVRNAEERAANQFAAELLMPRELIIKAIDKMSVDFNMSWEQLENLSDDTIISYLADVLKVSRQAMKYRLINLNVLSS